MQDGVSGAMEIEAGAAQIVPWAFEAWRIRSVYDADGVSQIDGELSGACRSVSKHDGSAVGWLPEESVD